MCLLSALGSSPNLTPSQGTCPRYQIFSILFSSVPSQSEEGFRIGRAVSFTTFFAVRFCWRLRFAPRAARPCSPDSSSRCPRHGSKAFSRPFQSWCQAESGSTPSSRLTPFATCTSRWRSSTWCSSPPRRPTFWKIWRPFDCSQGSQSVSLERWFRD